MENYATLVFTATIDIIGVNPFVFLPEEVLKTVFQQAGKAKGTIPVKMTIDGHEFPQTLVKYSGHWRLYLNMPMRKAAGKDVGDTAVFGVRFDPEDRTIPMHPKFSKALDENPEAREVFEQLPPSRRLEIVRYLSFLKTEESLDRNITRAIGFLLGKDRFIGRDKP
ncbi:MAG TPA: YdeI/OmpD-associated family protein [Fluviicola sp.]|nr:YdeI/OmpD-associated family protein [Fluviicola sp.]